MNLLSAPTNGRYLERLIFLFAGLFTLISVILGYYVSPTWFIFTGFVGFNLTIFGLTGFCTFALILRKLGAKSRLK